MNQKKLLLAVPVLFFIHNLEESLNMPGWMNIQHTRFVQEYLATITYPQFLAAVVVITIGTLVLGIWQWKKPSILPTFLLLVTQAVVLFNIPSHLVGAYAQGGYVPGLVTALVINLPFSIFLFMKGIREQWFPRGDIAWIVVGALISHGPGLFLLMFVSGLIFNR